MFKLFFHLITDMNDTEHNRQGYFLHFITLDFAETSMQRQGIPTGHYAFYEKTVVLTGFLCPQAEQENECMVGPRDTGDLTGKRTNCGNSMVLGVNSSTRER